MGFALFLAGLGALFGLANTGIQAAQANEQAQKQKEHNEKMYELNKARAEEDFNAAKEQAERNAQQADLQADLADQALNINEQGLSTDFNTAIDNMYLNQQADTMSWNQASMQAGASEGQAYATLAGSGVRAGSSLSDAVLLESAVNESQLQFSQDAKRRSDNNNLASVLANLAGNQANIRQNRIGADMTRENAAYLRNSYLEGGHNYNLYQNQLAQLQEETNYSNTHADYIIQQNSGMNFMINAATSMFQGAAAGYTAGSNLNKLKNKLKAFGG